MPVKGVPWHGYGLVDRWLDVPGAPLGWHGHVPRKLSELLGLASAFGPRCRVRPSRSVSGCHLCAGVPRFGSAGASTAGLALVWLLLLPGC